MISHTKPVGGQSQSYLYSLSVQWPNRYRELVT